MAKIRTQKYTVKGVVYSININCTSAGLFTANIPHDIARPLGIENRLEFSKLIDLENDLSNAFQRYKKAQTTQEMFIAIKYGASGDFYKNSDGENLCHNIGESFHIASQWREVENIMGLDFFVWIKETVDGKVTWYKTRYGYNDLFGRREDGEEKAFHKYGEVWHPEKFKKIPYCEDSLNKLELVKEKIRAASEVLFNFVSQDEEVIAIQLQSQSQIALM